ncbi:MAG: M48 family metalloprotease [Solirubrobacterales bacterium]|nr:M48 family metalloprotease [Solirubrobacterales bacterium]
MNPGPATGRGVNVSALALTGAGALLVAVLAVLVLSPDQGPPASDPAAAARVIAERFTPHELSEADSYRSWARAIGIASLLVQFGTLAFLAFWRGRPMRRLLERLGRHPLRGALLAGAGISLLLSLAGLPIDLAAWKLGRDFGLVSQALGPRLLDWLLATLIAIIPAAIGALIAMAMWRRLKGKFWIFASILVAAWAVIVTWLWPVVVSPLFNDFERLPDGPERSEVIRLADRAGVEVGEVYEVDASRRSSTLNAYVNGIGSSKRVVIYDNSIRELDSAEFSALVAHELGHVKANDLVRGLAFALLVIPLGVLFVQFASGSALRRNHDDFNGPALIPVLALMVTLTAFVLQVPGNALSRNVEAKADRFALSLTGEPEGLVDLQVGLAKSNLSDVDPPAVWQFLFGTHPSTIDRIAIAEGSRSEG